MKKLILLVFPFFISLIGYSQNTILIGSLEYQNLKASGELNTIPDSLLVYSTPVAIHPIIQSSSHVKRENACEGWIEENDSLDFILAMEPNDDGSSDLIELPFEFCLYGETYSEVYINNNGNISFVTPYGTFSAAGFPSNDFKMVAPFWADVDTRGVGEVLYAVTPTALIVKWIDVGYFAEHTDLINNFQLIVTDGTDPIIPGGNNVQFSYLDMQWTTGDASGGVDGFGGIAANVGANKGDGIDYIQFGRFDHDGIDYDGPFAGEDGVSWLDYETFVFNTCTDNSNIAPIINGLDVCDTLTACEGDTLYFQLQFLSPEEDQITSVTYDAGGSPYFGIISNVPGINATVTAYFVANPDNIGANPITFTATDNGIPAGVSIATIIINVIENPGGDPVPEPILSGELEFCEGGSTFLVAENYDVYDYYEWSTGSVENDIEIFNSGTYIFTGHIGLCINSAYQEVVEHPNPTPEITGGPLQLCPGDTAILTVPDDYEVYNWSNGPTDVTSITVLGGTYTVSVVDEFGCEGTSNAVTVLQLNPVICVPDVTICTEDLVTSLGLLLGPPPGEWTIIDQPIGSAVLFNPSENNPNAFIFADSSGLYTFVFTDEICLNSDTMNVSFLPLPSAELSDQILCPGETITLDAGNESGYQFFDWEWKKDGVVISGENTQTLTISEPGTYSVNVSNNGECAAFAVSIVQTPTVNINTNNPICGLSSEANVDLFPNNNAGAWSTITAGLTISNPVDLSTDLTVNNYGLYTLIFTEELCNVAENVEINFLPVPSAELPADFLICISDTITVDAGNVSGFPSFTWVWTKDGTVLSGENNQTISITAPGEYIVTVSSGISCITSDTVQVDEISVDATTTQNICGLTSDASVVVSPQNISGTGSWTSSSSQLTFGNPNEAFTTITATVYGSYTLTYTDDRCPLDFDQTDVVFYQQPEISIANNEICPGDNLLIVANVTGDFTGLFSWTFDGADQTNNNDSIYYTDFINPLIDTLAITATVNSNYCLPATAILEYVLFVCNLEVPNVISPNGDLLNENFVVPFLNNIPDNTVKIWNRWGNLVFDQKNYKNDWNGKDLSEGVYFYEIKVPIIEKPYKGSLTIIRK